MVRPMVLIAFLLILAFAAAQLVQPARTNPPTDEHGTLETALGASSAAAGIIDRACGECHTNKTEWRRHTTIAPVSWVIAQGVIEGRKAVNFSTWAAYAPQQRRALLKQSCDDARRGTMPPSLFILIHPQARLSKADIATLCAAANPQG